LGAGYTPPVTGTRRRTKITKETMEEVEIEMKLVLGIY